MTLHSVLETMGGHRPEGTLSSDASSTCGFNLVGSSDMDTGSVLDASACLDREIEIQQENVQVAEEMVNQLEQTMLFRRDEDPEKVFMFIDRYIDRFNQSLSMDPEKKATDLEKLMYHFYESQENFESWFTTRHNLEVCQVAYAEARQRKIEEQVKESMKKPESQTRRLAGSTAVAQRLGALRSPNPKGDTSFDDSASFQSAQSGPSVPPPPEPVAHRNPRRCRSLGCEGQVIPDKVHGNYTWFCNEPGCRARHNAVSYTHLTLPTKA